jgi:gentisate 1,2-dioxygenase
MSIDEAVTTDEQGGLQNASLEQTPELLDLYRRFEEHHLSPLWTQTSEVLTFSPRSRAVPYAWRWSELYPLAARAGELVPVGRGGERRAIALANPGLDGAPYATPTLWTAIQYLGPHETAPEHRHSQNAFRFVIEGDAVWTVVNGDPVAMSRGDFLLTPGWNFHGHHNATDQPMAWLDGLDVPLSDYIDIGFFEYGTERVTDEQRPARSRSERLWAYPGLRPLTGLEETDSSPIAAYRWEYTDRALNEQLALEAEGFPGTVGQGHAAIRYVNPTTGGDVMPTVRAEFHRLLAGTRTPSRRDVGSAVWQVFDGSGEIHVADQQWAVQRGDVVVVPSWAPWSIHADSTLDLFTFSDAPVIERLRFARHFVEPVTE